MTRPFEFPRHPLSDKTDPFVDAEGQNPFRDDGAVGVPESAAASPYDVHQTPGSEPAYRVQYETVLRSRGPLLLWLGGGSLGASVLALLIQASQLLVDSPVDFVLQLAALLWFIAAGLALVAMILGRMDLGAIRDGVMEQAARGPARAAVAMAVLSSVVLIALIFVGLLAF